MINNKLKILSGIFLLSALSYSDTFLDKQKINALSKPDFTVMEELPEIELIKVENVKGLKATEGFPEIYLVSKKKEKIKPKVITLTGLEYEENKYKLSDTEELVSYILADGIVKLNDNWGILHVVKDINKYVDGNKRENNFSVEVKPRYTKWVNPNFSYGLEFGVKNRFGDSESSSFIISPDISLSYSKHFLNLNFTDGFKTDTGKKFFETEPLYIYKLTDKFNVGAKAFWKEERDDFGYTEYAIRPLVQYTFDNGIYLELRLELGRTEFGNDEGYEYKNYCLYSITPINEYMNILFEYSYRDQKVHSQPGWGDKKGTFGKLGIIWNI